MDCLVINGYVSHNTGLVFDRSHITKMDDAAREDACREYQSSLEDLTFNSKPHINMLTILAEENLHFAKDIVAIIEAQISKAPAAEKLPVLYLVDSIVKNVGGEYLAVFAKNLVTSFICVFEKVDENTRKSLFKLRSTWDEIFPLKKLYALDVRVNSLDPAWPIKPLPPTVNASIHVNPRFLKHPEEVTSPRALSPAPMVSIPAPLPMAVPSISEKSITQEQVIRQQLLAKQKQLLELQQKKIELELEQTKAQLSCPSFIFQAANVVLSTSPIVPKAPPPAPVIKPCILPVSEPKPPTRDPRLNRVSQGAPQAKESTNSKKDCHSMGAPGHTPEKHLAERPSRLEKTRPPKKDLEIKAKSNSLSPMPKVLGKSKHYEAENVKTSADTAAKKDPRLKKHPHDKADPKDEDVKEKKKCTDRKERDDVAMKVSSRGKMANGQVSKPEWEKAEVGEKAENQIRGNARTNARKRSRSRSRSPMLTLHSPKRKTERRSPKRRARSISPSPPSHKPGKGGRQSGGKHSSHPDDFAQHGTAREERVTPKKSLSEPRKPKRLAEERPAEARETHSSTRTPSEGKETKENKRWRSGWEENKHLKSSEEAYGKGACPPRRPSYSSSQRPTTPRTPKQHRLSVDANLQIPEALHSASKRDLLKKASKRLENGEISKDDFLNVAHQIKQLFQYQEEKQRGGDSWEGSIEDGRGHAHQLKLTRKKPLLATPPGGTAPGAELSDAELTYYEHKSKLRRTRVMLRQQGQEGEAWDGEDSQDEGEAGQEVPSECPGGSSAGGSRASTALPSVLKFTRASKDGEDEQPTSTAIIQEYSHGNEFPRLKSMPGLRFRRRQDPRESSATDRLKAGERERNSPLSERLPNHRSPYGDREEPKSGYDAPPRRYAAGPPLSEDSSPHTYGRYDDRKPPGGPALRKSTNPTLDGPIRKSPVPLPVPAYERERLSPLQQMDAAEMSPIPRFESPNSEHSDDGPLAPVEVPPPPRPHHPGGPPRGPPLASIHNKHKDSPGHTPPHAPDGHQRYDSGPKGVPPSTRYEVLHTGPQSGYEGPGHVVKPSRPHHGGRYEGGQGPGRYDGPGGPSHGPSRYDEPQPQGPNRFDGPLHKGPERFDGPGRFDGPSVPHGPMRGGDPQSIGGRFEGVPNSQQQGGPAGRYDGLIGQPLPGRFDGQGPGPLRFDGPMQSNHFDGLMNFNNSHMQPGPGRFEGPLRFQPSPMRFDGPPNQPGPMRFDGPVNPSVSLGQPGHMRFDPLPPQGMPQRFDCPPSQHGPSLFHGPPQGMPQRFDCPASKQGPHRYLAPPNPQPPLRPLGSAMFDPTNTGGPQQQASFNQPMNTNFQPFPGQQNAVVQQGVVNFPVPPAPGSQPGFNNSYVRPPFSHNTVPFNHPAPNFPPPESHFGQVDVNDLLSKLISTGIISSGGIKPTPSTDTVAAPSSTESDTTPPAPLIEEEEEEEQEEDENLPDLTGFAIDDMKLRYDSVVTKLYTGIQCYSCGMRFTASQTDVYADHLDWHYRQNRSEKDVSKKVTHRRWYYSLMDWIEFEEIADLEERAKSLFFEKVNEEVVQKTQEAAKEKEFQSVKAAADVVDETCVICQEQFEMYWEEDEEEWHLRDAIRFDEKTYHPSCFEDYKNTSSFLDVTPSPNKLLMENPLNAFIKHEEDDPDVTSSCAAVKKEVEALSLMEVADDDQIVKEVQVKTEGETQSSAIS